MAFDPSTIADANIQQLDLNITRPTSDETEPVQIIPPAGCDIFSDLAPVKQGAHPAITAPVSRWDFDNISGSTLEDVIGTDDGTITNLTDTAGGPFDRYLAGGSITSVQRYVDFGSGTAFKSISIWVQRSSASNYGWILTDPTSGTQIWFDGGSDFLTIHNGSSPTASSLSANDTNWHHLVIVEGTNSNTHWLYLDGVKASAEISSNLAGVFKRLGVASTASGHEVCHFTNIQLFDFKLSDDEVTALYNADLPLSKKLAILDKDDNQCPVEVELWEKGPEPVSHYTTDVTELTTAEASDDFTGTDGDAPDPVKWLVGSGSGGDITIQSNALNYSISSATGSEDCYSCFTVTGDFDIQVDFTLGAVPSTDKWYGRFYMWDTVDDWVHVGLMYEASSGGRIYRSQEQVGGSTGTVQSATTSDTTGKLRIVRSGTTATMYYWNGSSWTTLQTKTGFTSAALKVRYLGGTTSSMTFDMSFDNFTINSADNIVMLVDEKGQASGTIVGMTPTVGGVFDNYLAGGSETPSARYVDFGASGVAFKSVSIWFQRISTSSAHDMVLSVSGDTNWVYVNGTSASINIGAADASLTVNDTNWHHIILVEGSTSGYHWVWLDGVKSATEISTNYGAGGDLSPIRYIGRSTVQSGNTSNTTNLQCFDFKLTDAQIAMLYAAGTRGNQLVANHAVLNTLLPIAATAPTYDALLCWDETQDDSLYVGETGDSVTSLYPQTTPANYSDAVIRTYRNVVAAAAFSEAFKGLRLSFGDNASVVPAIDECWIGHAADSGNAWDFDGNQVQVTMGGATAFTITSDGQLSDVIDFDFDPTKDVVISILTDTNIAYNNTLPTNATAYFITGDSASDTAPAGYSSSTTWAFIKDIIGVPPNHLAWPSTYNARYGMSQDPSGGTGSILDSTSNALHGDPTGTWASTGLVDVPIGKAIDFSGSNYINISDDPKFGFVNYISVMILLSMDDNNAPVPIAKRDSSNYAWEIAVGSDAGSNVLNARINDNANAAVSSGSTSEDVFQLLTMTYDKTTIRGYINADADGTDAYTTAISTNSVDVSIGRRNYTGAEGYLDGKVAEVRLINATLSADQITIQYASLTDTLFAWSAYSSIDPWPLVVDAKKQQLTTDPTKKPTTPLTNEPVQVVIPPDWAGFAALGSSNYKKIAILDDDDNQKPVEVEVWEKGPEPISRWDFDNISGTTLEDVVGTDDGTISNLTDTAGGPFERYLAGGSLTSVSRNVDFGASGKSFKTISLWVKRTDTSKSSQLFRDTANTNVFYISDTAGVGVLVAYDGTSSNSYNLSITDSTTWHHIVIVEGASNNSHWIWVDGVKSSSAQTSNFAGVFRYYSRDGTTSTGEAPDVTNIQVFDFKLTDAQVAMLYAAGTRGNQLVANHAVLNTVLPSTDDTGLVLVYDETKADNTNAGDVGDAIAQTVWPSSYKARYGMNQDPATEDLIDSTAYGSDGTFGGTGTTSVDSLVGKAISFDGNGYADLPLDTNLTTLLTAKDFLIIAKVKASASGDFITNSYRTTINDEVRFVTSYVAYDDDSSGAVVSSFSADAYDGTYRVLAFLVTTSTQYAYLDGTLEDSDSISGAGALQTPTHMCIGARSAYGTHSDGLVGELADIRFIEGGSADQITIQNASLTDTLFTWSDYTSGSLLPRLQYWDQPYGNFIGTNLVYWDQSYALLNYIVAYFDQVYGIQLQRYWDHTYGNSPLVRVFWDLLYGDQQQIKRFWDLEYGDRVELIRYWDQKYNIRTAIQQYWDQKYGIMGKEILKHWDQSYDVKNTNPLIKWFDQYYHIIADSVVESAALGFYIDGVRYEGPYHVSWELNVDSFKNTGEMHFNYPAPFFAAGEGKEMRIVDTDIDLKLEITIPTKSEGTGETLYFIKGESKSRILERAEVFTETFRNTTAATICTTIAARYGITIDWQIPDWPLSEYDVNDQTPLQAIRGLTGDDCAKACLQTDFDGDTVRVVKRKDSDSDKWDTDTPSYYITDSLHLEQTNQRGEYKKGYNAYRVTDQSSASETRTWIEDEEYADSKREVHVFRVPWDGTTRPLYTSDNNATIQYLGIVTEDLEEEFSIVNGEGEGKTKNPAYAVVSWSYNDTDLGTPTVTEEGVVQTTTEGTSMLTLTYTTKYYKWIVTDYDDPKIQIWVE